MNYRHVFHAGGIADCFKHAALVALIERLAEKPAGFAVLDTHAGIGLYDLDSDQAARTGEWQAGIGALWRTRPPGLARYVDLVAGQSGGALVRYPGSPALAAALLRPQDRLICCELHPEDVGVLRQRVPRAEVHHRDGYEALKALLPPRERRGLALIDPPYEDRLELLRLADALPRLCARWPTGHVMLWYPIKDRPAVDRFHAAVVAAGLRRLLVAEFLPGGDGALKGSGLLLVNPPWRYDETLAALLPDLAAGLELDGADTRLEWLVGE